MAAKLVGARVIHQGHIAFGAALGVTAVKTKNLSREAPSIQKEHGLATLCEGAFDGLGERPREDATVSTPSFFLALRVHVDDFDRG